MKSSFVFLMFAFSSTVWADNSACARFNGYSAGTAKWAAQLTIEERCKSLTGQQTGLSVRGTCLVNAEAYRLGPADAGKELILCLDFPMLTNERIFGAQILGIVSIN